jgi:hypothetical protein
MKRKMFLLVLFIPVLLITATALAGHEHMVIPYEAQALGMKSMMPIPAGGDLRHHIVSQEPYKKNFKLWPGKGELYAGKEPHGSLLTTYVNEIALKSIEKHKGMENNSIIVKENYTPEKKLAAVTVMYKVKGYNPDGGDWFWVKYDAHFNIIAEGKVEGCLNCHGSAKANDYLFTGTVVK